MRKSRVLRSFWILVLFLPQGVSRGQSYDTALAPYPSLKESFSPEVEALLGKIAQNAPPDGAFSATVAWTSESGKKLDLDRRDFGPFSLKSCPNWHFPPGDPGYWEAGAYTIAAAKGDFRIDKPADEASSADWWQKDGEHTYARAWSESWPTIWRFHQDAFEAGMLGYPEGLGLLLWASQPGEYVRRADHLEVGQDRTVGGTAYKTLVATPAWIAKPLFLENRSHYPFNESTLLSWAPLRPVITYFIDPKTGVIVGAEFIYHKVLRSGPKDWEAGSKPNGLVITCLAEEMAQTPAGTWYPRRIVGEVSQLGEVVRRTRLAVAVSGTAAQVPALELPAAKRAVDPWPKYRSEVYAKRVAAGEATHADLVGLGCALAYEGGDIAAAETAILQAVSALEGDSMLEPSTFGGIDWELGFAVYELLWRYSDRDAEGVWDGFPRTETWRAILAKAVHLYQKYWAKDAERIGTLLGGYEATYEARRRAEVRQEQLETYRELLRKDIEEHTARGDAETAQYLQRILAATQNQPVK